MKSKLIIRPKKNEDVSNNGGGWSDEVKSRMIPRPKKVDKVESATHHKQPNSASVRRVYYLNLYIYNRI